MTQEAFGSRLRMEREKRGLTLKAIADSTKIQQSLLAGLERGDVTHWPGGLFRRAYVREYASAIGLPTEPLVEEFGRLFPEEDEATLLFGDASTSAADTRGQPTARPTTRNDDDGLVHRVRIALFDVGLVAVFSAALALPTDVGLLPLMGILAPSYLVLTSTVLGCSGGSWLFSRRDETPALRRGLATPTVATLTAPTAGITVERVSPPDAARELRLRLDDRPRRAS